MIRLARRRFLKLAASAAALPAVPRSGSAQAYPSRPINVVVPAAPGSPGDVILRILAEHMRGALGQPLIVDNVAGANGTLGTGKVARAKPDGYTLAFGSSFSTHVLNGAIYSLPFDVKNDFEPIALVADNPQIILARKAAPANDLKELIGWLKAHPDKVTLGQTGPGSPAGVSGVLFQNQIGSRFQFVNYRNVGQALQDLVAGHIDVMFFATIALEHVRAGRIKAFAVTARNRLQIAPDIPTVHEAGVPGFYYAPWFAMWAPKDTPAGAIAKVNASVTGALADPAVRQRFADLGYDIVPREQQTPEALGAFHSAEIEKWWPILKAAGIRGE